MHESRFSLKNPTTRARVLLAIVILVALVIRVGFWVAVVGFDHPGWGDEPDYHIIATHIADGEGFRGPAGHPTACRPPLYPIVLGGLYRITGPDPDAGRVFQIVLGVLIVFLVYLLAARIFSRKVALLAAALAAINPGLVYLSALLMTENLYTALLLALVLLMVTEHRSDRVSYARFAVAGVLAGLCCLARPMALLFALLVPAVTLFLGRGDVGRRVRASAVLLVVAVLVIAPWPIRNRVTLGEWVTFTTHGGITFYESNNRLTYKVPAFRGAVVLPRTAVPEWDRLADLDEFELDREAWSLGWKFIRENPELLPAMGAWKFLRFWRLDSGLKLEPTVGGGGSPLARLAATVDLGLVYWAVVIPLFVFGLAATWRRRRDLVLLYGVIVVHTLLALAFHGSIRSRAPVEPVIVIFAAAAVGWIARRLRKRRAAVGASGSSGAASCRETPGTL